MSEISGLKNYTKLILKRKPSKEALIFFSYSLKDSNKFQINYLTKEISRYDSVKQILYCEADTEHDFVKYMDDFIGKCDLVLLLCSYNSLKSTLVVDEWTAAYAMKKPIILIYHRLEYIPPLLCSKIGIKFDKNNIQKIAKEVHKNILKLFPEE